MAEGSPESALLRQDFARLHDVREQSRTETDAHRAREDFREEGTGKGKDSHNLRDFVIHRVTTSMSGNNWTPTQAPL